MILNALYHIISLWCSRYSSFSITITLILCFPDWCPPTPAPLQEKLVPLPLHWRLLHVWSLTVLTMSRYKHVPSDSVVLTSKRWYLNFGIIPFMSMQSQSEQWRNVLIWCHFVYIWTENRSNNDPSLYFLHSSYTLKTFELISLLNFPYISRSKLQRQGQSEEQLLACSRSEEPLLDKLPCLYHNVAPDSWCDQASLLTRLRTIIWEEQKKIVWVEPDLWWFAGQNGEESQSQKK